MHNSQVTEKIEKQPKSIVAVTKANEALFALTVHLS